MRPACAQPLEQASTSGRSPLQMHASTQRPRPAAWQPQQPHRQRLATLRRVTNEGQEMKVDLGKDKAGYEDEEWMTVDPENHYWNRPELGVVERRVGLGFEDALFRDVEPDPVAMEYWFTEPPGGWHTEPRRLRKAPEEAWDVDDDSVAHPGEGRLALGGVREGQVFQGMIVKLMYNHGAQVDIGAEFDGLVPVSGQEEWQPMEGFQPHGATEAWRPLEEELDVGTALEVRVHRIRDPSLFRFPIQLVPTDPSLAARLRNPDTWEAPMDLRSPTMTMEELARVSGRDWKPKRWVLQTEGEKKRDNFEEDPDIEWNQMTWAQLEAFDEIASDVIRTL